jgi:hypothetical protein
MGPRVLLPGRQAVSTLRSLALWGLFQPSKSEISMTAFKYTWKICLFLPKKLRIPQDTKIK